MDKIWFFAKSFMFADISIDLIIEMLLLAFCNTDIQFNTQYFTWKFYSIAKTLPTARPIELINKHKLAKSALDKNSEMFILDITALKTLKPAIHFFGLFY